MRHIFIVNLVAGHLRSQKRFWDELQSFIATREEKIEVYKTAGIGDGETLTEAICRDSLENPEPKRFYACGGDGTLNEVINGVMGYKNIEVACIPTGTGNDFIRNFTIKREAFKDIESQLLGKAVLVDLIKYTVEKDGEAESRYCANMFNLGFDCNVVIAAQSAKKIPLVKNSFAYLLGIAATLARKKGANLRVEFDEYKATEGQVLMVSVGNGAFCGGGIKGIPLASVNDGLMDVSIVQNISRGGICTLLPKYKKGTHLTDKRTETLITYRQCKELRIEPLDPALEFCVDGEISGNRGMQLELIPQSLRFSLPQVK